jgi:hypothetical protein
MNTRPWHILFAAFLIVGHSSLIVATTLGKTDLTCPVCEKPFVGIVILSTNQGEGVCRDFVARAIGPQPVFHLVQTCPRCYFSGYLDDFQNPDRVDHALREKILRRPKLKPATPISPDLDPREIPAATRYELAAEVYKWRRASHEAQAWLYLRWAWVVRDDGSYLPPSQTVMNAMSQVESRLPPASPGGNQAERELRAVNLLTADLMEGRFDPRDETGVRLVVAMLLRRHGENHHAEPMLRALLRDGLVEDVLRPAVKRMIESIDRERRLLLKARGQFEFALMREEIKEPNRPPACYLLGEICRRLGDDENALRWYDRAAEGPDLDPTLRRWIAEQRELVADIPWAAARP